MRFYTTNAIILPRQARDRHRENLKKDYRCLRRLHGATHISDPPDSAHAQAAAVGLPVAARRYPSYDRIGVDALAGCGQRHAVLEPFSLHKTIHLPRQARDEHKETRKRGAASAGWRIPPVLWSVVGEENGIFEPFIYKNEHFTKTGSGQT